MPLFERTSRTYSIDDIIKTVFGSLDDIEITSWLVSAYDFYSRVVKDR